jgi:hypothetical protein
MGGLVSPEPKPGKYDPPGCHIWGWMLPLELEWLYARAQTMDSVTEVGSLHGRSAFALLKACRGPVYCIDPWNDEGERCLPSFLGYCGAFPNLHAVQGYSPAVIDRDALPDVDMTFIDGNHGWDDIAADVEAWLPKTRRLICGHDYQPDLGDAAGYPDVARYVDETFGDRARRAPDTSIWYVDL